MTAKPPAEEAAPCPERQNTDVSLRNERDNADELVETLVEVEADTDELTEHTRGRSDAAREQVRDQVDQQRAASGRATDAVARERELGDQVLHHEVGSPGTELEFAL